MVSKTTKKWVFNVKKGIYQWEMVGRCGNNY